MESNRRATITLTATGVAVDAVLSALAIASLAQGTNPTGFGLVAAANITALVLAAIVAGATGHGHRGDRVQLVSVATAILLTLAGARVIGLAVVLTNINPTQQLESLSAILLAVIGTALTIVLFPVVLVAATLAANWPRRFRITRATTTHPHTA